MAPENGTDSGSWEGVSVAYYYHQRCGTGRDSWLACSRGFRPVNRKKDMFYGPLLIWCLLVFSYLVTLVFLQSFNYFLNLLRWAFISSFSHPNWQLQKHFWFLAVPSSCFWMLSSPQSMIGSCVSLSDHINLPIAAMLRCHCWVCL